MYNGYFPSQMCSFLVCASWDTCLTENIATSQTLFRSARVIASGFTTSYNLTMAAANNGAFFDDTEADVRVLQDGVSLTAHKGAPPQTITDLTVFGMIYVANNYTAP
uniref:Uncharacterized protein n=1 Tax=Bigelowiella natans TaxID=227086 RepID=A0A7S2P414_BIGNA